MLAQPQDVILIAGKGHETYQDVKGVKSHFDDKEVLEEIFKGELKKQRQDNVILFISIFRKV